jgi:hypothetical protein
MVESRKPVPTCQNSLSPLTHSLNIWLFVISYFYLQITLRSKGFDPPFFFALLQTFHTPSFGDEEFDIPQINPHHQQQQQATSQHPSQGNMASYQQPQMMGNQPTDGMVMNDPSAYQQPLYLTGPPEHSMGMSVK